MSLSGLVINIFVAVCQANRQPFKLKLAHRLCVPFGTSMQFRFFNTWIGKSKHEWNRCSVDGPEDGVGIAGVQAVEETGAPCSW